MARTGTLVAKKSTMLACTSYVGSSIRREENRIKMNSLLKNNRQRQIKKMKLFFFPDV